MKCSKYFFLFLMVILFSLSSCEKLSLPGEDVESSADTQKVTILTRSSTNDLQYPLTVYAFDSSGNCAAQQTLNSTSENMSLSLKKGSYHIVALSNTSGYTLPSSSITLNSIISFTESDNYSTSPLQMGQADIVLGNSSQTVNLVMSYKVSTVNITLSEVPSTVTSASVTISQEYSSMNMNGEYSSGKSSTFQLTKSGSTWTSNNLYVFPGALSQTVFSISLTDETGTTSYGYTYNSPLQSATPYNLSGAYSSDIISLSGIFLSEGWGSPVALNFNFGPGSSSDNGDDPSVPASSFPKAGSIWNNHLVAYVYTTDGTGTIISDDDLDNHSSVNLLLLSFNEWTDVVSAYNENNSTEAQTIADGYTEGDLSGWEIPSKFEATYLKALYHDDSLSSLNTTITSNGGAEIVPLDSKGENQRYLCEDATYTFAWKYGSSITKAGGTVKYSLRLVNHVTITKQ